MWKFMSPRPQAVDALHLHRLVRFGSIRCSERQLRQQRGANHPLRPESIPQHRPRAALKRCFCLAGMPYAPCDFFHQRDSRGFCRVKVKGRATANCGLCADIWAVACLGRGSIVSAGTAGLAARVVAKVGNPAEKRADAKPHAEPLRSKVESAGDDKADPASATKEPAPRQSKCSRPIARSVCAGPHLMTAALARTTAAPARPDTITGGGAGGFLASATLVAGSASALSPWPRLALGSCGCAGVARWLSDRSRKTSARRHVRKWRPR